MRGTGPAVSGMCPAGTIVLILQKKPRCPSSHRKLFSQWGWGPSLLAPSPQCSLWPKSHTVVHHKILTLNFSGLLGLEEVYTQTRGAGSREHRGTNARHTPQREESRAAPHTLCHLHPSPDFPDEAMHPCRRRKDSAAEQDLPFCPLSSQVGKLRPKEGWRPTQGHTASQEQS